MDVERGTGIHGAGVRLDIVISVTDTAGRCASEASWPGLIALDSSLLELS